MIAERCLTDLERGHLAACRRHVEVGACVRSLSGQKMLLAIIDKLWAELDKLADPNSVHINLLCGAIAKPSWEQIEHLYPDDAAQLRKASTVVSLLAATPPAEWRSKAEIHSELQEFRSAPIALIASHQDREG